ncbi:hypothetical protein H072_1469 [Dactylellina haptotyla CBS 200.50]|uniref:Very-long-chain (3R)-3-hydroxyacyl-CoA dehydratase n=1 Tax=Dactylellina haptotyla (strain CBS 200.50) TaxID=1284197 RepID=S8ANK7_DACHA|nr:hypothetical protein H072_1469 [Dactylellina haptotyla CBS 200.50]
MASRPGPKQRQELKLKANYLVAYNTLSSVLWAVVLARAVTISVRDGVDKVYEGVGDYTKWTQTLAAMEIVHALAGIVRTPLMTTVVQVASRLNIVWPVLHLCPNSMRTSLGYTTMIIAWSVTEVIRYSYYARNVQGEPPAWLTTLRYNTFFVLYPVGILSEAWEIYGSLGELHEVSGLVALVEMVVLYGTYVPGAYVMYSHMMHQRRKMMRGKKPMRNQ